MRPHCLLLLASMVVLACFDTVTANPFTAVDQQSSTRLLRNAQGDNINDKGDERAFGLNHLQLWRMKRAANSEIKAADKAKAKAAAKIQKETAKEAKAAAKKSAQDAANAAEAQKKVAKEAQAAATKSAQETAKAAKAKAVDAELAAQFIKKGWSPERVGEFLNVKTLGNNPKISKFMETYKDTYAKGKDAAAAAAKAKAA